MKTKKNNDTDYGSSSPEASSAEQYKILSPNSGNTLASIPETITDVVEFPKQEIKQPTMSDYSTHKRRQWVLEQYLLGRYPYAIREEYKELYKLSDYSYDHDVEWANKQLAKRGEMELDTVIQRHVDLYYDIYRSSRELKDHKGAISSLKHIEDLLKLHSPKSSGSVTNIQVNHNNNVKLPPMSVEELRELVKEINTPKS